MEEFIEALGDEVGDADEETFDLFSQTLPLENLGMIEATAEEFEVTIGEREFTLRQSIGSLHSQRKEGTTGAAVWKVSARVAEWLGPSSLSATSTETNGLFKYGILQPTASVLELGSGVSGLVPLILGPRVGQVLATDQPYALKLLQENISANSNVRSTSSRSQGTSTKRKKDSSTRHAIKSNSHSSSSSSSSSNNNIRVLPLDWETDDIPSFLASHGLPHGVDVLIAMDTIYNYALLAPFTQTCIDICAERERYRREKGATFSSDVEEVLRPTVCVIAQQLRQAEVFAPWLEMQLAGGFRVWRVPEEMLVTGLRVRDGFAVHILLLRDREDG